MTIASIALNIREMLEVELLPGHLEIRKTEESNGTNQQPCNYRSIVLLPAYGKILENFLKLMIKQTTILLPSMHSWQERRPIEI